MHWLKRRIRQWLGITDDWTATCEAVRGLRTDHEALVRAHHDWRRGQTQLAENIVRTLNRTTVVAASLDRRLSTYERSIPQIKRVRAAIDAQDAKAQKKAERETKKLELVTEAKADAIGAQREAAPEVAE